MQLATQFIDPLFHSFYYMQCVTSSILLRDVLLIILLHRLNIYYLFLEKMNTFAEGRYDVTTCPGSQIQSDYENNRTDAWSQIEDLNITKRIISTCAYSSAPQVTTRGRLTVYLFISAKLVQSRRAEGGAPSTLGRTPSAATTSSAASGASRSMPPSSRGPAPPSFVKKAPPPPPGQQAAPPPPYSASSNGVNTAATKRPPPPPPLKPKPEPVVEYVTALYDFDAQVRIAGFIVIFC